jgi:hypothetical protein
VTDDNSIGPEDQERDGEVVTAEGRMTAFLMENMGLPFCGDCLRQKLGLAPAAIADATRRLAGHGRFKLTNRCCAQCFSEQAVIYLGMK